MTADLTIEPGARAPLHTASWPVSVAQLQRAWQAIEAGDFDTRTPATAHAQHDSLPNWTSVPGEQVVLVAGCGGGVGATTVALAIASVADNGRLVECVPPERSGLIAAASAELGETGGWIQGRRAGVLLLREPELCPRDIPPAEADTCTTVLDLGQTADRGVGDPRPAGRPTPLVLVTTATIPGLRRIERVLGTLPTGELFAASIGRPVRRWPRSLTAAIGPLAARLVSDRRWVTFPTDPALATRGIGMDDLPGSVLAAGRELLRAIEEA